MNNTIIKRLEEWFAKYCNGDWEHDTVIKLDTLGKPGWYVEIRLEGTVMDGETIPMDDKFRQIVTPSLRKTVGF